MKKIFYWKNILWPKRLQKNHFCSMYPPLASTTASNLLWAFSLIAHNISASVSSHAVIWLKCFCLKMFLWHPWLQKAWFFFQYKHHLPSQWPLMSNEVFFFKMQVTLLHHFWMHWGILTVCKSDLFSSMTTMTCWYTMEAIWKKLKIFLTKFFLEYLKINFSSSKKYYLIARMRSTLFNKGLDRYWHPCKTCLIP